MRSTLKPLMNISLFILLCSISTELAAQQTIQLTASQDNTLYESADGSLSNGQGDYIFVGTTARGSQKRRALVQFSFSGELPDSAQLTAVSLNLFMSKTRAASTPVSIHRLTQAWGEGSSNASGDEGAGIAATNGDATWLHRRFDTELWQQAGGDFEATASATTDVIGNGLYTWTSSQLLADVQLWLADPAQNFGWIVLGDESQSTTAKRFNSRENSSDPPTLILTYSTDETPTGNGDPTEQPTTEATPLTDPIPEPIATGDQQIRLRTVVTGLTAPNWATAVPSEPQYLYVVDQMGVIWQVDLLASTKRVFLDLSSRLISLGVRGEGSYDERGFLGLAFHPNYADNGLLYTYTSEPANVAGDFATLAAGMTANHQSVITEWQATERGTANAQALADSARVLMRFDQPQFNHDGGCLEFDTNGLLYIASGDGGGADDEHGGTNAETANGQNLATPLGKILRIDPQGNNAANGQYGIPADNPFVGQAERLAEIYAYGFRNPFRCSFDRATGEFYVADVGQNAIEEVDRVVMGGNYGWSLKEGSFRFHPNDSDRGFVSNDMSGLPNDLIDPIAEYDHDEGTAVIGGFVYRGSAIPALQGQYVFGDVAQTGQGDGRLFYLADGTIHSFMLTERTALNQWLLGFGQDAAGELYALVNDAGIPFGEMGAVLKLVPNATLNVAEGMLQLPAVAIPSTEGTQTYRLNLAYVPNSEPIQFRLLLEEAQLLDNALQMDNAQFDAQSNLLHIPVIALQSDAGVSLFSATLMLQVIEGNFVFELVSVFALKTSPL